MKVALVHDFLTVYGGAERVLSHIAALHPEAPIYTLQAVPEVALRFKGHQVIASKKRIPPWQVYSLPSVIEQIDVGPVDLVISSSNSFAHGLITGPYTKHLCYCHSPARYLWDYRFDYPRERGFDQGLLATLGQGMLHYLRLWDEQAAERPDQYIANSHCVAARIKRYYHQQAKVIYPPVDIDRFTPSRHKESYMVMITRLSEYKKVDVAIEAAKLVKQQLIIVGTGRDEQRLKALADPRYVEFLGYQSDAKVASILARATALIHPQVEDFGLTVVEALAAGTPVIAYRQGGASETLVDGLHGYLVADQTPAAFAEAMERIKSQTFSPTVLRSQAARFSSKRFTRSLTRAIHALIHLK